MKQRLVHALRRETCKFLHKGKLLTEGRQGSVISIVLKVIPASLSVIKITSKSHPIIEMQNMVNTLANIICYLCRS